MKLKNKAVVYHDYECQVSDDIKNEELTYHLEGLDMYLKPLGENNPRLHVLGRNSEKHYPNQIYVEAKGYVQGEQCAYLIHIDKETADVDSLNGLVTCLKRTFTHRNDYRVVIQEHLESGHSKVIEEITISCCDVEFPDEKHIQETIQEAVDGTYEINEFNLLPLGL